MSHLFNNRLSESQTTFLSPQAISRYFQQQKIYYHNTQLHQSIYKRSAISVKFPAEREVPGFEVGTFTLPRSQTREGRATS